MKIVIDNACGTVADKTKFIISEAIDPQSNHQGMSIKRKVLKIPEMINFCTNKASINDTILRSELFSIRDFYSFGIQNSETVEIIRFINLTFVPHEEAYIEVM